MIVDLFVFVFLSFVWVLPLSFLFGETFAGVVASPVAVEVAETVVLPVDGLVRNRAAGAEDYRLDDRMLINDSFHCLLILVCIYLVLLFKIS